MDKETIQQRIKDLERMISRDASYNVPSNRIAGELTLGLWCIALQLAEISERIQSKSSGE